MALGLRRMMEHPLVLPLCLILVLSAVVSSAYRGVCHDEGISVFDRWAKNILAGQSIFTDPNQELGAKGPARLIYVALIALSYKLVGINLLALHLFPYLIQIINPALFFVIAYRLYANRWWAFAAAVLFIFQPFNLVYLNQQHNHPIFVFFLLLLVIVWDRAIINPKWLMLFGGLATLLLLTRFEDAVIFVVVLYSVYLLRVWGPRTGIRSHLGLIVTWLCFSVGAMGIVYAVFAVVFNFPLLFPVHYLPHLIARQDIYAVGVSFYELTTVAVQFFLGWYFCGRLFASFLFVLLGIGVSAQLKKYTFYPLALFLPYFLFIALVYKAREDLANLEPVTFSTIGFILILGHGLQITHAYISRRVQRVRFRHVLAFQRGCGIVFIMIALFFFGRTTSSLAYIAEGAHPSTNMWRIVRTHPPLPGNPAYPDPVIQLSSTERIPVLLREYLYHEVNGRYRSWYLQHIGQTAFDRNLPAQERATADFAYVETFDSPSQWQRERIHIEGSSPLWNDNYPGQIGAFPVGKSGSFVYKFEFSRPIARVLLSDRHTQWGPGDVTRMWTSTDGEHWTLRYDNWNVNYIQDYYYQVFEKELVGQRALWVKYYFKAGDKTRTGNDNRGASLDEFSIAVTYQPEI